jgi:GAF domain-containing protein
MATADLQQLTRTFVRLADTLVDRFDVIELLHVLTGDCVQFLGVESAGVMLSDQQGQLRVAAASSEQTRLLELFELQNDQGPCLDCYRTGRPVAYTDLGDGKSPWPRFAAQAHGAGLSSVHAIPMRLRSRVIGALNLFWVEPVPASDDDTRIAQAFADIATIAILQERLSREHQIVAEQLQHALTSRVLIEQAKGILAERRNIDMDEAFSTLRETARSTNTRLSDLARDIVEGRRDVSIS